MSTIREVAARAGVSVTTVSRTLNNRGYISQKMRERISKAMAELNYQPNEVARSLSFQHTKMIGVLVPEIDNPFFSRIVSLLSKLLTGRGYKMLLYVASGTDDGIIIALRSKNIDHVLLGGMPAVSFERLPSGNIPTVLCDNFQGGRLAAQELLDTGCVCPVMIGKRHATENIPAFERFSGFRETVEAAGIQAQIYEIREKEQQGDYRDPVREALRRYPCAAAIDCLLKQISGEPYSMDLLFPVDISRRASTRGYLLSAED